MNSKCEAKPIACVASRETSTTGDARSPRSQAVAGRRKQPGTRAQPLPSRAQPAYEELLHFFNESADLLCIAGFDGRFKRLNPAWQPALGWSRDELLARPFLDFVHPDDHPATLAEMNKLATGGATITFENRYHCQDGKWKWLEWTASPLPGCREIYAIARDVTRQKRLEGEILETLDSRYSRSRICKCRFGSTTG